VDPAKQEFGWDSLPCCEETKAEQVALTGKIAPTQFEAVAVAVVGFELEAEPHVRKDCC